MFITKCLSSFKKYINYKNNHKEIQIFISKEDVETGSIYLPTIEIKLINLEKIN